MKETYTFKISPDYAIATYDNGRDSITLDEWHGRSLADFSRGMSGRGFAYRVDAYELSGGRKIEEHIWER